MPFPHPAVAKITLLSLPPELVDNILRHLCPPVHHLLTRDEQIKLTNLFDTPDDQARKALWSLTRVCRRMRELTVERRFGTMSMRIRKSLEKMWPQDMLYIAGSVQYLEIYADAETREPMYLKVIQQRIMDSILVELLPHFKQIRGLRIPSSYPASYLPVQKLEWLDIVLDPTTPAPPTLTLDEENKRLTIDTLAVSSRTFSDGGGLIGRRRLDCEVTKTLLRAGGFTGFKEVIFQPRSGLYEHWPLGTPVSDLVKLLAEGQKQGRSAVQKMRLECPIAVDVHSVVKDQYFFIRSALSFLLQAGLTAEEVHVNYRLIIRPELRRALFPPEQPGSPSPALDSVSQAATAIIQLQSMVLHKGVIDWTTQQLMRLSANPSPFRSITCQYTILAVENGIGSRIHIPPSSPFHVFRLQLERDPELKVIESETGMSAEAQRALARDLAKANKAVAVAEEAYLIG